MKISASLLVAAFLVLVDQTHAGSRRSFGLHRGFAPVTANHRSQQQQSTPHYSTTSRPSGLEFLESDADKIREVKPVNVSIGFAESCVIPGAKLEPIPRLTFSLLTLSPTLFPSQLYKNLLRGAVLRVASDLSGGTPLESIKCRVTTTRDGPVEATRNIIKNGGPLALWSGTPSRTVEGRLMDLMCVYIYIYIGCGFYRVCIMLSTTSVLHLYYFLEESLYF